MRIREQLISAGSAESTDFGRRPSAGSDYELALSALRGLPDHCAVDLSDLATRAHTEKLALIRWSRADLKFARLVASKVRPDLLPP